jgi:hypothetical protein
MLELYRAMRSAYLSHNALTMPGLDVQPAGQLICKHSEVIGHNDVKFIVAPRRALLFLSQFRLEYQSTRRCATKFA